MCYWYDHQNRRIKTTVGSTSTHYIWTGGQVLAEHNAANGNRIIDYIYAGGKLIAKDDGETPQYLLQDKLSIRATVTFDRSGAGYYGYTFSSRQGHLPFGEELGNSGTVDKHQFTSYERDAETATDYAVNRQYHNSTGRFNRVDPASSSYSLANPQSLNRYAYVHNDPVNATDSQGLNLDSNDGVLTCFIVPSQVWGNGFLNGNSAGLGGWTRICISSGGGGDEFECTDKNIKDELNKLERDLFDVANSRISKALSASASDLSNIGLSVGGEEGADFAHRIREQITAAFGNFYSPIDGRFDQGLVDETNSIIRAVNIWLPDAMTKRNKRLFDTLYKDTEAGIALISDINWSFSKLKRCKLTKEQQMQFTRQQDRWEAFQLIVSPLLSAFQRPRKIA